MTIQGLFVALHQKVVISHIVRILH